MSQNPEISSTAKAAQLHLLERAIEECEHGVAGQQDPANPQEVELARLSIESTVAYANASFDRLVAHDERARERLARDPSWTEGREVLNEIVDTLRNWIGSSVRLEQAVFLFSSKGIDVEGAEVLSKNRDEAKWMLAPAAVALDHPRLVESRDAAVDALRKGDVVER